MIYLAIFVLGVCLMLVDCDIYKLKKQTKDLENDICQLKLSNNPHNDKDFKAGSFKDD